MLKYLAKLLTMIYFSCSYGPHSLSLLNTQRFSYCFYIVCTPLVLWLMGDRKSVRRVKSLVEQLALYLSRLTQMQRNFVVSIISCHIR